MAAFTALAIGLGLAGVATKAIGEHEAGQAQEAAGRAQADISESQAQVADFNAHVADLQAEDAVERGDVEVSRLRTQVRGIIGSQRASEAGSNIDVGFGSAVDVQGDTAYMGKIDESTIKANAARTAWGFQNTAVDYRSQAAIDRKAAANQIAAGKQAATASNFAVGSTLLTGGASLLSAKYGFQKSGSE